MELKDQQAEDAAIREVFIEAAKRLIDHLINQNMMSNQFFLDRLRNEVSAAQRAGFEYHEKRFEEAAAKPITEDEKEEVAKHLKDVEEQQITAIVKGMQADKDFRKEVVKVAKDKTASGQELAKKALKRYEKEVRP